MSRRRIMASLALALAFTPIALVPGPASAQQQTASQVWMRGTRRGAGVAFMTGVYTRS